MQITWVWSDVFNKVVQFEELASDEHLLMLVKLWMGNYGPEVESKWEEVTERGFGDRLMRAWDADEMIENRQDAAKALLSGDTKSDLIDAVPDFFETVALAARNNLIPMKLVWSSFSYWIIPYWFAAQDRIQQMRRDDPAIWEDWASLMPNLMAYQAGRRKSAVSEVSPTRNEIARFLKEEAAE